MNSAQHWHERSIDATVAELQVDPRSGLAADEVRRRRAEYGTNELTPRRGKSPLVRFLLQFHNPLIYILLIAGCATVFAKGINDALTIFAVVLINAIIGYVQEAKAENAIAALAKTLKSEAWVMRDGALQTVTADELVPGDIVFLQAGNKVPPTCASCICVICRLPKPC